MAQHDLGHLRRGQPGALTELVRWEHADGVRNDGVWIVRHAAHRGELVEAWLEGFSRDANTRNAQLLEFNPVVHTARTARPSITYPGDGEVGIPRNLFDLVWQRRLRQLLFADHLDLADSVQFLHLFVDH